jgi:hypothetical protein
MTYHHRKTKKNNNEKKFTGYSLIAGVMKAKIMIAFYTYLTCIKINLNLVNDGVQIGAPILSNNIKKCSMHTCPLSQELLSWTYAHKGTLVLVNK